MLQRTQAGTVRQTRRGLVLVCVVVGMFMVAIEATIVSTAMPSIVATLGGFEYYSWIFTAFLLTQATTTVMFGKLADLYGRRPVLIAGVLLFLAASVLCGFAWSMASLIAFRLLQGLGAGSIQPILITLLGDLYTPEERIGIQGYIGATWAVSAVIGPLLGALIVQYWSWPWIFWINVPVGLLMICGMLAFLHEHVPRKAHTLDLAGAGMFFVAISGLLLALTQGAAHIAWALGGGALFLGLLPVLIWWERRAPEPMIPLALWTQPLVANANSSGLIAGMVFMGVTSFLPVYVQGVMGRSATQAGLAITMMSIGWPLASVIGRHMARGVDLAYLSRVGGVLIVAGCAAFPFMRVDGGLWIPGAASFLIGGGMGLLNNANAILVQSSVDWSQRGVATSSNVFARTLGSMLGAALLGGVLNGALEIFARRAGASLERVRHLLDRRAGSDAGLGALNLHLALDHAMKTLFVVMIALSVVTLLIAWRMRRHTRAAAAAA